MPRGIKKQINYTEEIEKIDNRIAQYTHCISELKDRKDELKQQQHLEEVTNFEAFLTCHNLTLQEATDLLSQSQQSSNLKIS